MSGAKMTPSHVREPATSRQASTSSPPPPGVSGWCPLDADAPVREAAQHHAVAVALAQAAEYLVHAALGVNAIGPDWRDSVVAWNREADDLLERALAFHRDASDLAALAGRCRS